MEGNTKENMDEQSKESIKEGTWNQISWKWNKKGS